MQSNNKDIWKIVALVIFVIVGFIALKPPEKVDNPFSTDEELGNILITYDEVNGRSKTQGYSFDDLQEQGDEEHEHLKKRQQINQLVHYKTKTINTDDEEFVVHKIQYFKGDNTISVYGNIINLSDNRKKEISAIAYDVYDKEIGRGTIYQNSLAKSKTSFVFKIKMKKGFYNSDIKKIEISAKPIEKDWLPGTF